MALESFQAWRPTHDIQRKLALIGQVLEQYSKLGITLTLRQLYYQLVSKNVIPNHQREYKRLGWLLSNARLAGRVDWHAIEDRVRWPERPSQWSGLDQLVHGATASYRRPRWADQPRHVELWCEKDALSSVISPITYDLHVTQLINRGYSSTTAMYDASKRLMASGKPATILYLGDFDPSGEDMVRDIGERLKMLGADVEVRKIALTRPQIDAHKLPPNPAKMTDSRAQGFVKRHGQDSFEVDALPPEFLMKLVREELEALMDMPKYNAWKALEEADKARLRDLVAGNQPFEIELGIVEQLTALRLGLA